MNKFLSIFSLLSVFTLLGILIFLSSRTEQILKNEYQPAFHQIISQKDTITRAFSQTTILLDTNTNIAQNDFEFYSRVLVSHIKVTKHINLTLFKKLLGDEEEHVYIELEKQLREYQAVSNDLIESYRKLISISQTDKDSYIRKVFLDDLRKFLKKATQYDVALMHLEGSFSKLIKEKTSKNIQLTFYILSIFSVVLSATIFLLLKSIRERENAYKKLKERETQLNESNRTHKQMISNISDVIAILDADAVIKYKSPNIKNLFGWNPEDLIGTDGWKTVHQDDLDRIKKEFIELQEKEHSVKNVEYRYKCQDGNYKWIELTAVNLLNFPPINGILMNYKDVTERKQAEADREKLQEQLGQAQKMESVGRLAGGVAHDFNNMLGVILGHIEMALEDVDPAVPLHASLQAVQYAAKRSASLTRQLLTFARKQTVAPKIIDINDTVEEMLKMLRQLIGEDIDLIWQPGRNLQPVKIDPSQIDQLLANLCVNARDAITGVGKVTIETDAKTFDDSNCADHLGSLPGEYVLLEVSDDGCGMDKKTLNQIFEPFFTTKEMGKGTGLGLASVFGIVNQNNGFINVYSELDRGTTFKIYLPAYAIKSDGVAEKAPELPTERGNETILLVEDEPAILEMTTRMLKRLGYTVVAAATPGEAIRLALEYRGLIDLLMTDVVMPEMNGRELAGTLLSHYPDLKQLFMSGYTANVIAHHGVLDEGVNFIQKPFSMKDLGGKLRETLNI